MESDFVFSFLRYELMVTCWHYIPENRLNFQDVHSRLNEIAADKQKEQPATWFSYEASSETVNLFEMFIFFQ